ncbi:ATP-binding protein [uncultured Alistipes sp.]|jgi:hypothetical protein|uniref:ATP-binding protein n=1 Tax=uncultured Alistipes sp. TaxID=538949 RepID=UPI0025DF8A70|nr:ATP-binding protein [uncultured Alistipes sp.]
MYNNIIFVGGIHGVGKSTVCQQICREVDISHLSASTLIKWGKLSQEIGTKRVDDIQHTQDRLIIGLQETIHKDKVYLLDGHYCLLNTEGVRRVPQKTFVAMQPVLLGIIISDVAEIKRRLEVRDGEVYDSELLRSMQDNELQYAQYLSQTLNIPLSVGTPDDFTDILISTSKVLGL